MSLTLSAFAWMGSAQFGGGMLGSLIGGTLAMPAGRIPILGDIKMFQEKPFVLPGMTVAAM